MSNKNQQNAREIANSVEMSNMAAPAAPKEPTMAERLDPSGLIPGAVKARNAAAAPMHKRARKDAASRRSEIAAGFTVARTGVEETPEERSERMLNSAAARMVETHTRQIASMKKKYPHIQAIQEVQPMSHEDARKAVLEGRAAFVPSEPKPAKPRRTRPSTPAPALKPTELDENGLLLPVVKRPTKEQ